MALLLGGCTATGGHAPAPSPAGLPSAPPSDSATGPVAARDHTDPSRPSRAEPPSRNAEGPEDLLEATDPAPASYPLDRYSRKIPMRGPIRCPDVEMVSYRGDVVSFQKPLRVYAGFVDHLKRFETIVKETAIEVYGRAPAKIWHYGPNRCRRIRKWPYRLSEHGLGNAIDIGGFEFAPVRGQAAEGLPRHLRRHFIVNLQLHWTARKPRDQIHSEFLRLLARRMIESEGLFRTILGPAAPSHKGHFHLDMAAQRNVVVF